LLYDAMEKGVINVVRYYHHETVCIGGKDNDINDNVQKGLDISKATNAFLYTLATSNMRGMMPPQSTSGVCSSRSRGTPRKRSSSSLNTPLPLLSNKRSCSTSPHMDKRHLELPNQIHYCVILHDHEKSIYKTSSQVVMLAALKGNIEGERHIVEVYYTQTNCSRI
jgi:hypothetical protein